MSVGSPFERQLAELIARGTRDDLREFVLLAGPMIYTFLNRIGVSPGDRDDLYQEVLIKVITFKEQFDSSKKITSWIFTIAVNLTRSKFRSQRRHSSIEDIQEPVSTNPDSLEIFAGRQLASRIEDLLVHLPLAQREAILICGFEQIDQKQAALILNVPEATLRTNLRRARIRLAEILATLESMQQTRVVV